MTAAGLSTSETTVDERFGGAENCGRDAPSSVAAAPWIRWATVGVSALAVTALVGRLRPVYGSETVPVAVALGLAVALLGLDPARRVVSVPRPSESLTVIAIASVVLAWSGAATLGRLHPLPDVLFEVGASALAGTAMAWDAHDAVRRALAPAAGAVVGLLAAGAAGATVGIRGPTTLVVPAAEIAAVVVAHLVRRSRGGAPPTCDLDLGRFGPWAVCAGLLLAVGLVTILLPYHLLRPALPFGADLQHPINIHQVLRTGRAGSQSASSDYYPPTFWYWAAALAGPGSLSTFGLLEALIPTLWLLSALNLVALARVLVGRYAALFALLVYCVCTVQPKQTVLDGTDIGVLGEYTLMPAALLVTYLLCRRGTRSSAVAWAALVGCLVQVHFLSFSRFVLVAAPFIIVSLGWHRRVTVRRVAAAVAGGAVIGLPYTWTYAVIYAGFVGHALGIAPPSRHAGSFPTVPFPVGFGDVLGQWFVIAAFFGVVCWCVAGAFDVVDRQAWWLLALWVGLVSVAGLGDVLLTPERDVRSLALPGALLIGFAATLVAGGKGRLVVVVLAATGLVVAAPPAVRQMLDQARVSVYASPRTIAFLGAVPWTDMHGTLVTDASGVWAPYFAGPATIVIQGGPSSFASFGAPLRGEMQTAWSALHPCGADSARALTAIGVRMVFLGPPPNHWSSSGYVFVPGSELRACPGFRLVREDPSGDDYLYAVG